MAACKHEMTDCTDDNINHKYCSTTDESSFLTSMKKPEITAPAPTNEKIMNTKNEGSKFRKFMKINKPLIPLKISLFLWFAGAATVVPYFNLYILQLGISVSQFSFFLTVNPVLQFVGPTISGIIADKIGRSKPVLVVNIVLTAVVINSILLVPPIRTRKCFLEDPVEFQCDPVFSVKNTDSRIQNATTYECFVHCANNRTFHDSFCFSTNQSKDAQHFNKSCEISDFSRDILNLTEREDARNIDANAFCGLVMKDECVSFCKAGDGNDDSWIKMRCPHVEDNSALVVSICLFLSCMFAAVLSNCYRFMDVTTMFMVKAHNSDFGRERFWSILSVALISPLAGYIVDLTTPEGAPRNCATAIYFVDGIFVVLMFAVAKLEVQIYPPGRNMMKNSLKLMNNPDVMIFALCLLILGTSWGFSKLFSYIYLDHLGSPSILMGLMLTVNSVCGLPFLLTSDWWIKKLGSSNLLLYGFLGYVFLCLGYSFLENPWHALIYETSSIFTYHLLWVAVIRHSHEIAPEGLAATVISCAGGIHYALGKGFGSLIGGQVMSKFGGRWAYRLIAIICCVSCLIYGIYLSLRKRQINEKQIPSEKTKM